ncbi:hypothetical protein niasHT_020758 [Heterodera trifolii]|uniref:Uncharacterized protein n=1 Tax=Heterodera trifolii TaxID=157864 RepID=A0ABD2KG44_9BILA
MTTETADIGGENKSANNQKHENGQEEKPNNEMSKNQRWMTRKRMQKRKRIKRKSEEKGGQNTRTRRRRKEDEWEKRRRTSNRKDRVEKKSSRQTEDGGRRVKEESPFKCGGRREGRVKRRRSQWEKMTFDADKLQTQTCKTKSKQAKGKKESQSGKRRKEKRKDHLFSQQKTPENGHNASHSRKRHLLPNIGNANREDEEEKMPQPVTGTDHSHEAERGTKGQRKRKANSNSDTAEQQSKASARTRKLVSSEVRRRRQTTEAKGFEVITREENGGHQTEGGEEEQREQKATRTGDKMPKSNGNAEKHWSRRGGLSRLRATYNAGVGIDDKRQAGLKRAKQTERTTATHRKPSRRGRKARAEERPTELWTPKWTFWHHGDHPQRMKQTKKKRRKRKTPKKTEAETRTNDADNNDNFGGTWRRNGGRRNFGNCAKRDGRGAKATRQLEKRMEKQWEIENEMAKGICPSDETTKTKTAAEEEKDAKSKRSRRRRKGKGITAMTEKRIEQTIGTKGGRNGGENTAKKQGKMANKTAIRLPILIGTRTSLSHSVPFLRLSKIEWRDEFGDLGSNRSGTEVARANPSRSLNQGSVIVEGKLLSREEISRCPKCGPWHWNRQLSPEAAEVSSGKMCGGTPKGISVAGRESNSYIIGWVTSSSPPPEFSSSFLPFLPLSLFGMKICIVDNGKGTQSDGATIHHNGGWKWRQSHRTEDDNGPARTVPPTANASSEGSTHMNGPASSGSSLAARNFPTPVGVHFSEQQKNDSRWRSDRGGGGETNDRWMISGLVIFEL